MGLLSQIVPLRARCLHLICRVPECFAVNDYSGTIRALQIRQIHLVKNPGHGRHQPRAGAGEKLYIKSPGSDIRKGYHSTTRGETP